MISLFSPLLAAAESSVAQAITAATAVPLGALKKSGAAVPGANATLSPEILKSLQQNLTLAHKSPLAANAPWLTHSFAALFMLCAIGLIVLLAVQTTKQEGLSGTIGGRVESTYRPRLGFDQQLARLTSGVAIGMVFFGVVLSITGI